MAVSPFDIYYGPMSDEVLRKLNVSTLQDNEKPTHSTNIDTSLLHPFITDDSTAALITCASLCRYSVPASYNTGVGKIEIIEVITLVLAVTKSRDTTVRKLKAFFDKLSSTDSQIFLVQLKLNSSSLSFNKSWSEFKKTKHHHHKLTVGKSELYHSHFDRFVVGSEISNYELNDINLFSGLKAGMLMKKGMKFSTYDNDSDANPDGNCASLYNADFGSLELLKSNARNTNVNES
ncbi:hypothetical protein HELRODRAFT_172841 [Helobdella robusta]|uniref:Fibrinogen C-terminal domain-containing protein n=1 Tax=Helobdella robusta TaxID=6412 RepID=T1F600_HELRO|nr:hypothetical protein HELRODRAFT_172841 [Helobdella robusta]ESO04454.1 hypothetical protein HELRODRAFT_172841 [Helobdella robusta]